MSIDLIIASLPDKSPEQRAQMRRNAEDKLKTGTDPMRQAAQQLLDALDDLEQSEQVAFHERLSNMPIVERIAEAFRSVPPTETELKLLRVLLDNPGATSTELSQKLGWEAQSWHMHFGKMCQSREVWLWPAAKAQHRDGHFYSGILAEFEPDGARFTMKPDVATALQEIGIGGPLRARAV